MAYNSVREVTSDQCQFEQKTSTGVPVKKPTGWMSNCPGILKQLDVRCKGEHRGVSKSVSDPSKHAICSGRIARDVAIYPFKLCKAILSRLKNQLVRDGRMDRNSCGILEVDFDKDDEKDDRSPSRQLGRYAPSPAPVGPVSSPSPMPPESSPPASRGPVRSSREQDEEKDEEAEEYAYGEVVDRGGI